MKIVIFGNGLIGSQTAARLREAGHDVTALGRGDVDTTTGAGIADAVAGAEVVVDLTNSPSWADEDVLAFLHRLDPAPARGRGRGGGRPPRHLVDRGS